MHPAPPTPPAPRPPTIPFAALTASIASARALLSGPPLHQWLRLAGLAVMAGLVGAGAPCPPLGLLEPVWEDPSARQSLLGHSWALPMAGLLLLFLLLLGGFGRSFTLAFFRSVRDEVPRLERYREYVRPGAAHYVWSGSISLPLSLLLLAVEWQTSRTHWAAILASAGGSVQPIVVHWALELVLELAAWTLVTFPLRIWMYELTPAAMVLDGAGPAPAASSILRFARKFPGAFWLYLAIRLVLQLMANAVALAALLPSLLLAAPAALPALALGWCLNRMLGGWSSPAGAAVGSVAILLSLAALYGALCSVLVPVSLLVNGFALHTVRLWREGEGR